MAQDSSPAPRRPSLFFPILLIVIGAIFLYAEFRPNFDPWPLLRTYWPLILIFLGLAKMWDSARARKSEGVPYDGPSTGGVVAAIVVVIVLVAVLGHTRRWGRWHSGTVYAMQHLERSVNRDDAKNVDATIQLGAGDLDIVAQDRAGFLVVVQLHDGGFHRRQVFRAVQLAVEPIGAADAGDQENADRDQAAVEAAMAARWRRRNRSRCGVCVGHEIPQIPNVAWEANHRSHLAQSGPLT